jgi:acetyltransferase-like isoleucine patch superfamily enzyme
VYIGTMLGLGAHGRLTMGDFSILNGVVVCTNGRVDIGSYTLLAHEVTLAGRPCARPPREDDEPEPPIVVGDDAWIGVRATLIGGAVIGRGAIVGAATVVDGVVPDYAIVAGNPARIVGEAPPRTRAGRAPAGVEDIRGPGVRMTRG